MGPCDWEFTPVCPEWATATDEEKDRARTLAVGLLWKLTGRVFGVCTDTVRPCFAPPSKSTTYRGRSGGAGPSFWPGLINGSWRSGSCGCSGGCGCVPASEVALPGPIVDVTSVTIDGDVVDPAEYRVRNRRWLVRVGSAWPQTQDLEAGDLDVGAFTVNYRRGVPLPADGQFAAGDLACEFLRSGADECQLPARAQSVSRQGVDIQLLDPAQYFDGGLTGVPSVDQWIKSVNPQRQYSPPAVFNADTLHDVSRMR